MTANPILFNTALFQLDHRGGYSYRRHVALQLAALIAKQRDFAELSDLRMFCSVPDNLAPWLPSRVDRVNLAAELSSCL